MEKVRLPIYVTSEKLRQIDKYVFKKKMEGVYHGNRPYSRTAFFEEAIELKLRKIEEEERNPSQE